MATFPIGATVRIRPDVATKQATFIPAEHLVTGCVVEKPADKGEYPSPDTHTLVSWGGDVYSVWTEWLEMV